MSLSFTATTHLVNCGAGAAISTLGAGTCLAWVYRKASADQRVAQKGVIAIDGVFKTIMYPSITSLSHTTDRATTDCSVSVLWANVPGYALNQWCFWATVWDINAATADQKVYGGNLNMPAKEATTYDSRNVGSGAIVSDASAPLILGNKSNNGAYFNGLISWIGLWKYPLSASEIQSLQYDPRVTPGCVGFWRLGRQSAGLQWDESGYGNHGAVTGAVLSWPNVPLITSRKPSRHYPQNLIVASTGNPWYAYAHQ